MLGEAGDEKSKRDPKMSGVEGKFQAQCEHLCGTTAQNAQMPHKHRISIPVLAEDPAGFSSRGSV